jgi:TonB family protein
MATSLKKVLIVDQSEWKSVAPPYWRDYVDGKAQTPIIKPGEFFRTLPDGTKVFKCGGQLRCPKPTYTPDPEYSEPARKARYMATATFEIVVDGSGRARNIQVKKPAGMGLDENGVASLQKWQFKPAELDGKPVAVLLNVEVRWSLY